MVERQLASLPEVGPLFAGDTGPTLELVLLYDGGGFVNLQGESEVSVSIRRYDPRRKQPLGAVITAGDCTIVGPSTGRCNFDWQDAEPVASVPRDTGWYIGQATVTIGGRIQHSQRFVFEVIAT